MAYRAFGSNSGKLGMKEIKCAVNEKKLKLINSPSIAFFQLLY